MSAAFDCRPRNECSCGHQTSISAFGLLNSHFHTAQAFSVAILSGPKPKEADK